MDRGGYFVGSNQVSRLEELGVLGSACKHPFVGIEKYFVDNISVGIYRHPMEGYVRNTDTPQSILRTGRISFHPLAAIQITDNSIRIEISFTRNRSVIIRVIRLLSHTIFDINACSVIGSRNRQVALFKRPDNSARCPVSTIDDDIPIVCTSLDSDRARFTHKPDNSAHIGVVTAHTNTDRAQAVCNFSRPGIAHETADTISHTTRKDIPGDKAPFNGGVLLLEGYDRSYRDRVALCTRFSPVGGSQNIHIL